MFAHRPYGETRRDRPRRPYRGARNRALIASALIVLLYFLIPVEPGVSGARLVVRGAVTLVGVLVIGWLTLGQVRRQVSNDGDIRALIRLAVALVAGVMIFALADYVIAVSHPGQFAELRTKIDALYFSLATLTTVGYGDVHAAGQLARTAVCLQLVFSVGVVATGASLLVKRLTKRPDE